MRGLPARHSERRQTRCMQFLDGPAAARIQKRQTRNARGMAWDRYRQSAGNPPPLPPRPCRRTAQTCGCTAPPYWWSSESVSEAPAPAHPPDWHASHLPSSLSPLVVLYRIWPPAPGQLNHVSAGHVTDRDVSALAGVVHRCEVMVGWRGRDDSETL